MNTSRIWLFRSLVAVAAGLMVITFVLPWWVCNISGTLPTEEQIVIQNQSIWIYAYGLHHNLTELAGFISQDETPFYQTVIAFIYLTASVGLILYSTWLTGRKGGWLLGGLGFVYIAYASIAVIWMAIRTANYGVVLQGTSFIERTLDVRSSLQPWFYLAYVAGLMCLVLALLHSRITGRHVA
jgi:hypothetical protein